MGQAGEERLYRIRTNAYYSFFCGVDRDGTQTLMAANGRDGLILYRFDDRGELIGTQTRRRPAERVAVSMTCEFHRLPVEVPEEFVRWQEEIGFEHRAIAVRRFFDEERRIGIEERPAHCREFLADPRRYITWLWEGEEFTDGELDEEIRQWHAEIERWDQEGMFVFRCGNDYYCNRDGAVTSS